MKLERFRTRKGLMLRPLDNKALFEHCAGSKTIPSRREGYICELLHYHNIGILVITTHDSV